DRLRPAPRGGRNGPRRERMGAVPQGDAAVDRASDSRVSPALLRNLDRRLRRHLFQRGPADHVPALRLGCGARRCAAAGERDRQRHLSLCSYGDGRERVPPDAARAPYRYRVTCEPRLPPWWWDEAGADEPAPPLEGDVTADVCVVGGGFTGLWTTLALRKREPSLRVVLLEAETCGAGPSGRNGGFLHGYWASLAELLPLLGRAGAFALARAGGWIVPAVRAQ